jgi:prepilin-type N-terminal cleavage/methylation domain-containing protein
MSWVQRRGASRSEKTSGFSVPELVVVIAVIGVLFLVMIPFFLNYYQGAAARADVQQIIALLNQARELAIKQNDSVCVTFPDSSQMALLLGGCGGTAWVGPGTDGAGTIKLPQGFTISPLNPLTFNYLGAANAATSYTMTNTTTGGTMTISIALTGRVTSP